MPTRDTYLIVLPSLTLGGCETQGLHYAKAIVDAGIGKPLFISLGREGELLPLLKARGFDAMSFNISPFHNLGRLGKFFFLIRFCIALRKTRPLAIIAQSYWPNLFSGVVWRFTGASHFFWIQGSLDRDIAMTIWERFAVRMRPTYLANSETCSQFIMNRHKIKDNPSVIYNGLRIPEMKEHRIHGPVQLLMVANFYPEKDHATVLRAFAMLLNEFPDARLHLVGKSPGSGWQMTEVKALACDLKLSKSVIFHGPVKNVASLLRMADIGILSTFSEGLSNSLLEYMAFGLPVVATDIAPNREALGKDSDSWLFPCGDETVLLELLQHLCRDQMLRVQVGQRNRQEAAARFSLPVFNERFIRKLSMSLLTEPSEE